jgi:hypothetical protein
MVGPDFSAVTIDAWDVTDLDNISSIIPFNLTALNVGKPRWLSTDNENNGKYIYIGLGIPNVTAVQVLGLNNLDQGKWQVGALIKNVIGTENANRVRSFAYGDALWLAFFAEGIYYFNISDRLNPVLVDHIDTHPETGTNTRGTDVICTTDISSQVFFHQRIDDTHDKFSRATLVNGKILLEDTSISYPDCDSVLYPEPCQFPGSLLRCYGYTDSTQDSKLVVVHSRGFDVWNPDTEGNMTLFTTYSTLCEDVEWGTADTVNGVFVAVTPNIPSCSCPNPASIPCPALPQVVSPESLVDDMRLIDGGYIDYFGMYDAPSLDSITNTVTAPLVIPDVDENNGKPSLCGTGYQINNLKDAVALTFYPSSTPGCSYSTIVDNAKSAGAVCVFIVNHEPGPVYIWGAVYASSIPSGIISKEAGDALYEALTSSPTTPPSSSMMIPATTTSILILVESVLFFLIFANK